MFRKSNVVRYNISYIIYVSIKNMTNNLCIYKIIKNQPCEFWKFWNHELASSVAELSDEYCCMKSVCGIFWLESLEINISNWKIVLAGLHRTISWTKNDQEQSHSAQACVQMKVKDSGKHISYSKDEINESRFATDFSSESVFPFLNSF